MRADPDSTQSQFSRGLLDPSLPVPASVMGSSLRRYGVYRNNVTVGLVRAIEANFPIVRRLLGEKYFEGFVREFVQKHPPSSPLLFEYGEPFASYLESATDLQAYPYLGDVARLEQQVRISHHGADAPCLAAAELAQVAEDDLPHAVFHPRPTTALLKSNFAIYSIYRANRTEAAGVVTDASQAQTVLVTRPQYDVELHNLDRAQTAFVESLLAGQSFATAADAASAARDDFDLTSALGLVLASGAFQYLSFGTD